MATLNGVVFEKIRNSARYEVRYSCPKCDGRYREVISATNRYEAQIRWGQKTKDEITCRDCVEAAKTPEQKMTEHVESLWRYEILDYGRRRMFDLLENVVHSAQREIDRMKENAEYIPYLGGGSIWPMSAAEDVQRHAHSIDMKIEQWRTLSNFFPELVKAATAKGTAEYHERQAKIAEAQKKAAETEAQLKADAEMAEVK